VVRHSFFQYALGGIVATECRRQVVPEDLFLDIAIECFYMLRSVPSTIWSKYGPTAHETISIGTFHTAPRDVELDDALEYLWGEIQHCP
jgi:hypothetical protein